jgi:uncharacterized membrane protein YeaQ/YmgE (transglycosylase-associated protein family)
MGNSRDMLAFVIVLLIIGLIAGAIARLLVPGRDSMGLLATIALGIIGSFVGGFVQNLFDYHKLDLTHPHTTGFIGSIIGAIILLLLLRLLGANRGSRRR